MLQVEKIINTPVTSCCYMCFDKDVSNDCIIIDPASEDDRIFQVIEKKNLNPEFIILTHEHFDHCLSVNDLRTRYPMVKLICSQYCNDAIQDEKKNCSLFWDNTKGFIIRPADLIIGNHENILSWGNYRVIFYEVPGHTKSSIAIEIGEFLFTGDAYIPGLKTVTKLPGGNRQLATESENLIKRLAKDKVIYPGHKIPGKRPK